MSEGIISEIIVNASDIPGMDVCTAKDCRMQSAYGKNWCEFCIRDEQVRQQKEWDAKRRQGW